MKKMLFMLFVAAITISVFAEDIYLRPEKFISPNTFIANGKTYRIEGIKGGTPMDAIACQTMLAMLGGKEYKFLPAINEKSTSVANRSSHKDVRVVRFGVFNRAGKHQNNPDLRLLRMGLVKYDPRLNSEQYRKFEDAAKRDLIGIWYHCEK